MRFEKKTFAFAFTISFAKRYIARSDNIMQQQSGKFLRFYTRYCLSSLRTIFFAENEIHDFPFLWNELNFQTRETSSRYSVKFFSPRFVQKINRLLTLLAILSREISVR